MIVKKIHEPILFVDVLFLTDCKPKEVEEYAVKNNINGLPDCYHLQGFVDTMERKLKGGEKEISYIVWIENKNGFYTLIHEIVHLITRIFTDRSIPISKGNDEIFAYYQNWWFKKLWRIMNQKTNEGR